MTEDWTKLDNTLDQIRRLQPNYVSVWLPGLEPVLQRLRRMGRLPRTLLLGSARHQRLGRRPAI